MTRLAITLLALGLLGASCQHPQRQPLPEAETREYRSCETDADCEYANNGCCDCSNGGEDIAINRAKKPEFRARFTCDQPCSTRGPLCGGGRVSCEQHLCTYTPPSPDQRSAEPPATP